MIIQLEIPDSVTTALRVPPLEQKQQLLVELAVALYARGILSFGKARELCEMPKYEFGVLLGKRDIPRHYSEPDLKADLNYANR